MLFVLVLFLHRRLGHVLLDGLVGLPGLMRRHKDTDAVTVGDLGVDPGPAGVLLGLTWVLMESCSARNHSLMTPSFSDWIRSSVPCRVFSCRTNRTC